MNDPQTQTAIATVVTVDDAMRQVTAPQHSAVVLRDTFAPFFQALHELTEQASKVSESEPKKARALRLSIRDVRIGAEKAHKELKADSLLLGRAIDGVKNVFLLHATPLEKALSDIENAEEIREQKRKQALAAERLELLKEFPDAANLSLSLGDLSDEHFKALLDGLKSAKAAKEEAEKKAQQEAEERARAEAAEREHLRIENEKLKAEQAKRDEEARIERERLQAEQDKKDAAERAERERLEAAAAEERRKAEAAAAEAKRLRDEAEAKERAEREAKEAEERKKAEAKERAEQAPDKEKVFQLRDSIALLVIPSLKSKKGLALQKQVVLKIADLVTFLEREAEKL